MKITMSTEEFKDTIDDATNAVIAAVNALLFDRYGKRAYTAEERDHELKVVMHMIEAYTTEVYVYGDLDVMVTHPYRADPVAEEVICEECQNSFTRGLNEKSLTVCWQCVSGDMEE